MKSTGRERDFGSAGLVYVDVCEAGITRHRKGRGYCYRHADGSLVTDEQNRARIAALGIPPAYTDVWICPDPRGHVQATGYDARGRKQYRYHEDWQALRAEAKYADLLAFGKKLPQIRRTARADAERLAERQRAVLGALVLLLDAARLRVGNHAYLKSNGTYGATTLLKRHVSFGPSVELRFLGKGRRRMRRTLNAPRLQRILEHVADLPGRQLFGWEDDQGVRHGIDSGMLNQYLAEIGGPGISAKVFRTWGGTLAAFEEAASTIRRNATPTIKALCEAAARELSNTPAVCRKSYVHPQVLLLTSDASLRSVLERQLRRKLKAKANITVMERRLLKFLHASR